VGGPGEEFLLENLSVSMDDLVPGCEIHNLALALAPVL
jgi:hypothetical protein